jgi:large conductance mechanosensitive channel
MPDAPNGYGIDRVALAFLGDVAIIDISSLSPSISPHQLRRNTMWKDFKAFVLKGNVLDLAIAVVIGVAFGAIVTSLVNDIIMPLVGIILGRIDFAALAIQVGSATVTYGKFIQACVNFLIIAFVIFLVMRAMVKMKKQEAAAPPPGPTAEEKLLTEIRDLLKAGR